MPDDSAPLIILAPPRSFTSVVCAMLGQHPQMFAFPETHLFAADTLRHWRQLCDEASYPMADGLLRVVAELFFERQTEATVEQAMRWLQRRSHLSGGAVFSLLAEQSGALIPVDKSPSTVYEAASMERCAHWFPQARYLHLLRHPRGYSRSVLHTLDHCRRRGVFPYWLWHLAAQGPERPDASTAAPRSHPSKRAEEASSGPAILDPQHSWLSLHGNILHFLRTQDPARCLCVRGEDLLRDPQLHLTTVAHWLGLRTDAEAVEAMQHPEHSPFAGPGPANAPGGNDPFFQKEPAVRRTRAPEVSLTGALEWRSDNGGFQPEVIALAREFGYQ